MRTYQGLVLCTLAFHGTLAAPLLGGLVGGIADSVTGTLGAVLKLPGDVLNELLSIQPGAPPGDVDGLRSTLDSIWAKNQSANFYDNLLKQVSAGINPLEPLSVIQNLAAPASGINSVNNNNPRNPAVAVFPQKDESDAPYSLEESQLRAAIYIPETFTYGKKTPVILVPGTGAYGGETFQANYIKLLTGKAYADPLWLNIPGAMLDDTQVNSEYIAYAINYIAGITGSKVAVISWSQGGLDTQWALNFWPSTRKVVSDFLPISPDFHGTILGNAICLSPGQDSVELLPCAPSAVQQQYNSLFVAALRSKGGASALVPTTTFYSALFDEVVQPQAGTDASAYLPGPATTVTNVEVQTVCAGRLAGTFYGHAGMLYNPLAAALVVDALTHGGPGKVGRLNLDAVCNNYIAPGLSLTDAITTAGDIVIAGTRLLASPLRVTSEPPLKSYAA